MLALNLHSRQIGLQGFFYFKLFICPVDIKRPKLLRDLLTEPSSGFRHEPVVELIALRDPKLGFTTFENSLSVQKMDITKTAWINA